MAEICVSAVLVVTHTGEFADAVPDGAEAARVGEGVVFCTETSPVTVLPLLVKEVGGICQDRFLARSHETQVGLEITISNIASGEVSGADDQLYRFPALGKNKFAMALLALGVTPAHGGIAVAVLHEFVRYLSIWNPDLFTAKGILIGVE